MKKLLLLIFLLPAILMADTPSPRVETLNKQVVCSTFDAVLAEVAKISKTPVWLSKGSTATYYALFSNKQTKEWVLIEFDKENACIIGVGNSSTFAEQSSYQKLLTYK